jgi:hypothetical protein
MREYFIIKTRYGRKSPRVVTRAAWRQPPLTLAGSPDRPPFGYALSYSPLQGAAEV